VIDDQLEFTPTLPKKKSQKSTLEIVTDTPNKTQESSPDF